MYVFTYKIGIKPINSAVNCTFQVNKSVYFLHDWYVQILHIAIHECKIVFTRILRYVNSILHYVAIHDNSQSKSIS